MSTIDEAEVELRIAAIAGRVRPDKVHELRCVRPWRAHDASHVSDASGLEERRHCWRGVAVDRGQRASAVQAECGGKPTGGASVASAKLEDLAGANVPYELAQRAAEDWIVLRTGNPDDGFLDHGKRINFGFTRRHGTSRK
jgi:hypothetical protein